jgi:hypothetical protein
MQLKALNYWGRRRSMASRFFAGKQERVSRAMGRVESEAYCEGFEMTRNLIMGPGDAQGWPKGKREGIRACVDNRPPDKTFALPRIPDSTTLCQCSPL